MGFATRVDNAAVGQHHREFHDVVFGGAVFDGLNARGIVGDHTTDSGIGPRVGREKQPLLSDHSVELFAQNARLNIDL